MGYESNKSGGNTPEQSPADKGQPLKSTVQNLGKLAVNGAKKK